MTALRFLCLCVLFISSNGHDLVSPLSPTELQVLRNKSREMFLHGYNSYLRHAFPADELMPLSCKGRYRGVGSSRGDIDDALGNFSLTLVDAMDGLALMGLFPEFESAVKLAINNVHFDTHVPVNLFEVNIRMLGGLLSSHLFCKEFQRSSAMNFSWYKDELLQLALNLGRKMLPAFDTKTGLPRAKIFLDGSGSVLNDQSANLTCTACAGTFILEFQTLSYLTGDCSFAQKACRAMDYIWHKRDLRTNLVGSLIDVENGQWYRTDSTIGAGTDSYYEYLLKGYAAFGFSEYMSRFEQHYASIMRFMHVNYTYRSVRMDSPYIPVRHHMDSLMAFWPSIQVEYGDIQKAAEFHEFLLHVVKAYGHLPEAFTSDLRLYWSDCLLRPEMAESTYYLYRATKDPYYLNVGKLLLQNIESEARVTCGFAAFQDIALKEKQDRLDSFFLAETMKYLYLLFTDKADLPIRLENFVLSTEAHIIPRVHSADVWRNGEQDHQVAIQPMTQCVAGDISFSQLSKLRDNVRKSIRYTVSQNKRIGTSLPTCHIRLNAHNVNFNDIRHRRMLQEGGIFLVEDNNELKAVYMDSLAKTTTHARWGLRFIEELSSRTAYEDTEKIWISFFSPGDKPADVIPRQGLLAQFSNPHTKYPLIGQVSWAADKYACSSDVDDVRGKVALILRGNCEFQTKASFVETAGAIGGIVLELDGEEFIRMDGSVNTSLPFVFIQGAGLDNITNDSLVALSGLADGPFPSMLCPLRDNALSAISSSNMSLQEFMTVYCLPGIRGHRLLFFDRVNSTSFKINGGADVTVTKEDDQSFFMSRTSAWNEEHSSCDFSSWASNLLDLLGDKRCELAPVDLFQIWRGSTVKVQNGSLSSLFSALPWNMLTGDDKVCLTRNL